MRLLDKNTPICSHELIAPWRLLSLGVGLAILVLGSFFLPSDDWDLGICFVMGLPSYVISPWVFRQVYYFRWKWLVLAAVALWLAIDGFYSFYWYLRGFEHLARFRPANFVYCTPIFWMSGFVWNLDLGHFNNMGDDLKFTKKDVLALLVHFLCAVVLALTITYAVRIVSGLEV